MLQTAGRADLSPEATIASPSLSRADGTKAAYDKISSLVYRVKRRWRAALVIWAGVVLVVAAATFMIPAKYTTSAQVLIDYVAPLDYSQNGGVPAVSDLVVSNQAQTLETYVTLMESDAVAASVIRRLHLNMDVDTLESHTDVEPITNTNVLDLSVSAHSPQESARIANAYVEAAIDNDRQLNAARARDAVRSLSRALDWNHRVVERDDALQATYAAKYGLIDPESQKTTQAAQASSILDTIRKTEADRAQAQAQLAALREETSSQAPTITALTTLETNPVRAGLLTTLAQVTGQLQQARSAYTPRHPVVVGLEKQRLLLQREIAAVSPTVVGSANVEQNPIRQTLSQNEAMLVAQVNADDAEMQLLHQQQDDIRAAVERFPQVATRLEQLKRESAGAETVYEALKQKYAQAVVAKAIAPSDMSLIAAADPDTAEKKPRALLNLAIAFVVGLVLGIAGALFRDARDGRLRTPRDTIERLNIPAIAHVAAAGDPLEAADALRIRQFATIAALRKDLDLRCIAVVNTVNARSKRAAAEHIARAFAEVYRNVLLVDADVTSTLTGDGVGFTDILGHRALLEDCIERVGGAAMPSGVTKLQIGTDRQNLLKTLTRDSLSRFVNDTCRHSGFEMVVVQAPPVTECAEALAICAGADLAILEVILGEDEQRSARAAIDLLLDGGAPLAGAIVVGRSVYTRKPAAPRFARRANNAAIELPAG